MMTEAELARLEKDADSWESLTTGDAEQLIADYREAVAAAETYHEAWQDAAVYWKAERDQLKARIAELEQQLCPLPND